ncbi:M24 family metallopeptidase [Salinithrix halophila]|uniref:M24 family metallopeptidase n=1 Tax=Salinithrix halophila TaxID=1485204 RepID=A0ABV8JIR5_9BACL
MEKRLSRLRKRMTEENLEALLISNPINRRYLTGFTGSAGWVLITGDQQYLISDFRYDLQVKEQAPGFTFVRHAGNPFKDVKELMGKAGVKEVAFEQDDLTFRQFKKLEEALDGIRPVAKSGIVEKLREIKEEEELVLMREAAAIADRAFEAVLKEIRPGRTEKEIDLKLEFLMREMGATSSSFATIVASGPRSALPHGVASDRVLEKGDLVTLDFGALYKGYCSDMTRTVALGKLEPKQKEIYDIVLTAQKKAVDALRPGITGKEGDAAARDVIEEQGYGEYFGHTTGHGLGMEVHELPSLSHRSDTPLEPGMVVTVEPGIYLPETGGVRIEDDVLVTKEGHEVFTSSPKELIIID